MAFSDTDKKVVGHGVEQKETRYYKELSENLKNIQIEGRYEGCKLLEIREHNKAADPSTLITAQATSVVIPYVVKLQSPLDEVIELTVMAKRVPAHAALHEASILKHLEKSNSNLQFYRLTGSLDLGDGNGYVLTELIPNALPIGRLTKLTQDKQVTIIKKLATSLARLHKAGVLHQDPHSNNFLLSRVSEKNVLWCIDFGLSEIEEPVPEIHRYDELDSAVDDLLSTWMIYDLNEELYLGDIAHDAYHEEFDRS